MSGSARGRERGREGETEGGREGGRAAAAAVARASLPGREAAALHLWRWGAEKQVMKALPEAGLDQARETEPSRFLPSALEGREGREIGARRPDRAASGNVEPVFDFRLTLML